MLANPHMAWDSVSTDSKQHDANLHSGATPR